jgi:phage terminase large subunit-like protein
MKPTEAEFRRFCEVIGLQLEPWQDLLIDEFFAPRKEAVFMLPRGCGKTTLLGALSLFELLRDPNAAIVCAAASREQAGHLFGVARRFTLSSEAIKQGVTVTRRELRTATEGRLLVISAATSPTPTARRLRGLRRLGAT